MKKEVRRNIFQIIAISSILWGSSLFAIETSVGDDVDAMELRSIVVEGWEQTPWKITSEPGNPIGKVEVKLVDGLPKNLMVDSGNKKSMAVRFQFVYPGNNTIVMVPPDDRVVVRELPVLDEKTGAKKSYNIQGIKLPGKVKALSVWVLGRGNEYNMEAWIEDWKGDTHIYQFGSLDFVGWKPLTVVIPEGVPQDVESYPQTKNLVLKKLVIRSTPKTSNEKVVLFFDSLKVLTDMYDVFFDGADMNFDEADKAEKEAMKRYEEQLKNSAQGSGNSGSGAAPK